MKDGVLECPECDAPLPAAWNFERARTLRGHVGVFRVDALVEPGERDEDRVGLWLERDSISLVLADGAGNSGRGRVAAETATREEDTTTTPRDRLAALDPALRALGGEAAVVIARLAVGNTLSLEAALAGDVRVWGRARGAWRELSEGVPRKPLVGSGAVPHVRVARELDAVLCASDGLVAWPGPELDDSILTHDDAVLRLVDRVRLRSGRLADDVSIVWVRAAR